MKWRNSVKSSVMEVGLNGCIMGRGCMIINRLLACNRRDTYTAENICHMRKHLRKKTKSYRKTATLFLYQDRKEEKEGQKAAPDILKAMLANLELYADQ